MEYEISAGEHERLIEVLNEEIARAKASLERIEDQAAHSDNETDTSDLGDDYDNTDELRADLEELRDKIESHATATGPTTLDVDDWERSAIDQAREIAAAEGIEQNSRVEVDADPPNPFLEKLDAFEKTWDEQMGPDRSNYALWEPSVDEREPSIGVAAPDAGEAGVVRVTFDPATDQVRYTTNGPDGPKPVDLATASRMLGRDAPDTRTALDAAGAGLRAADATARLHEPAPAREPRTLPTRSTALQPARERGDRGSAMRGGERYGAARHDAPQAGARSRGIER